MTQNREQPSNNSPITQSDCSALERGLEKLTEVVHYLANSFVAFTQANATRNE